MFETLMENAKKFWLQVRLTYALFLDPRVPALPKAIPVLTLLYLLTPIDLIPDFILVIGQIDDVVIALAAMEFFERNAPEAVVAEHRRRLSKLMGM